MQAVLGVLAVLVGLAMGMSSVRSQEQLVTEAAALLVLGGVALLAAAAPLDA